ncbi:MAG TPA: hypothetical protein VKV03_18100 [Candidatus Binataceae bacterium]|nr:hypothetical protein [Candidatus Binataceae bacterium]
MAAARRWRLMQLPRNVAHFAEHFRVSCLTCRALQKGKLKLEVGVFAFVAKAIHDLMDALDFVGNSLDGGTTSQIHARLS